LSHIVMTLLVTKDCQIVMTLLVIGHYHTVMTIIVTGTLSHYDTPHWSSIIT